MLKLKKVAITGGISSGKTTVANYFEELGAYVVRADEIVHKLLSPETIVGKQVIDLLGKGIVVDNKIDRSRIAKKVFSHPKLIKELEKITHPAVYEEIEKKYEQIKETVEYPLFVAEIALLYETKKESWYDTVIAVLSNTENTWLRYRNETGYEHDEFDRRMGNQLSPFEKAEKADIVIHNDGTLEELKQEVKKQFNQLTSETKSSSQ